MVTVLKFQRPLESKGKSGIGNDKFCRLARVFHHTTPNYPSNGRNESTKASKLSAIFVVTKKSVTGLNNS